jgi:CRISPR/Cas system CSM-associated protein Csm3 (group 7 of RAMP superfamily)
MIPATAFAGAVRHYLGVECEDKNSFFGFIDKEISEESKIKFYDAIPVTETYTAVRDSVKLEEKVGVDGAKFDKEAVETNAEFITMFELHNASDSEKEDILKAIAALNAGMLRIGSKTSRGYGQIEVLKLQKASFNLPDDRKKWLDFSPYDYESGDCYDDISDEIKNRRDDGKFTRIHLELSQHGAISIRSYTVKNINDIGSADWIQLSTNDGVPVIPGTSWAGAFRQRFREFSENDDEFFKDVWGYVDEKKKAQQKSRINFSESRISGGTSKLITRNSIDRFSAGTKEGALYTEKTIYNGKCSLDIDIRNDVKEINRCKEIISAVICDLDNGYLAVGGLTSVGRGIFSVDRMIINDNDVTDAMKRMDISAMTGGKKQ